MSDWIERVPGAQPGFERDLVGRYTRRLSELARRQLPDRVRRRIDPEDVVQSVYRSFFRRLNDGEFAFEDSYDVWRLLAAITFHKARKAVRFHHQARRDVRRELPIQSDGYTSRDAALPAEPSPGPNDLAILFDSLELLLMRLPEHNRRIVVLRLEGWSIEEIATKVNRSQSTVLRTLARARDLAAAQLDGSP